MSQIQQRLTEAKDFRELAQRVQAEFVNVYKLLSGVQVPSQLPAMVGHAGQVLFTNGQIAAWQALPVSSGGGTAPGLAGMNVQIQTRFNVMRTGATATFTKDFTVPGYYYAALSLNNDGGVDISGQTLHTMILKPVYDNTHILWFAIGP